MTERIKSAVDVIYDIPETMAEILRIVRGLDSRLVMLEQKMSMGGDWKPHGIKTPPAPKPLPPEEPKSSIVEEMEYTPVGVVLEAVPGAIQAAPVAAPQVQMPTIDRRVTATHVLGKLRDKDGKPLPGVNIKITDTKGKPVKDTRTAATGEWVAFLKAGEYVLEFLKPGMKPMIKTVTILPGQAKLEINE